MHGHANTAAAQRQPEDFTGTFNNNMERDNVSVSSDISSEATSVDHRSLTSFRNFDPDAKSVTNIAGAPAKPLWFGENESSGNNNRFSNRADALSLEISLQDKKSIVLEKKKDLIKQKSEADCTLQDKKNVGLDKQKEVIRTQSEADIALQKEKNVGADKTNEGLRLQLELERLKLGALQRGTNTDQGQCPNTAPRPTITPMTNDFSEHRVAPHTSAAGRMRPPNIPEEFDLEDGEDRYKTIVTYGDNSICWKMYPSDGSVRPLFPPPKEIVARLEPAICGSTSFAKTTARELKSSDWLVRYTCKGCGAKVRVVLYLPDPNNDKVGSWMIQVPTHGKLETKGYHVVTSPGGSVRRSLIKPAEGTARTVFQH